MTARKTALARPPSPGPVPGATAGGLGIDINLDAVERYRVDR